MPALTGVPADFVIEAMFCLSGTVCLVDRFNKAYLQNETGAMDNGDGSTNVTTMKFQALNRLYQHQFLRLLLTYVVWHSFEYRHITCSNPE
jgi:hypothetical protein